VLVVQLFQPNRAEGGDEVVLRSPRGRLPAQCLNLLGADD